MNKTHRCWRFYAIHSSVMLAWSHSPYPMMAPSRPFSSYGSPIALPSYNEHLLQLSLTQLMVSPFELAGSPGRKSCVCSCFRGSKNGGKVAAFSRFANQRSSQLGFNIECTALSASFGCLLRRRREYRTAPPQADHYQACHFPSAHLPSSMFRGRFCPIWHW